MFTVQVFPREGFRQRLVAEESFDDDIVVTIVASLSFMDEQEPERVTEWRAYLYAFAGQDLALPFDTDVRLEITSSRGRKLQEAIARAIFPHVDGFYNA